MRTPVGLVLLVFTLAACGSADPSPTVAPVGCTPGRVEACPCLGGSQGSQACTAAGTFGACVCSSADAGDASSSADSDAPIDARELVDVEAIDAPADVAPDRPADVARDVPRPLDAPPAASCYGACTTGDECAAACFVTGESHRFCCYMGRCAAFSTSAQCSDPAALPPDAVTCGGANQPTCRGDSDCTRCNTASTRWTCATQDAGAGLVHLCERM